jgi:serine/threonine protein kinase
LYFLKQLKDNNIAERRRRFYLETKAYQTVKIDGIPYIIDTNADIKDIDNKDIPLYYVAEYIDGKRLDKYINSNSSICEKDILSIFKQLLIILRECHSKEIYHRDIKPENIIIKEDGKLFLVDFGISHVGEHSLHLTKKSDELGNRFLRLPEFSSGSLNKRDPRSDLTLACGIALFMITKTYPRQLIDENGKFPHQVTHAFYQINIMKFKAVWQLIFDKAFQPNLLKRWNSSTELLEVINLMEENEEELNYDATLDAYCKNIDKNYLNEIKQGLALIHGKITSCVTSVIEALPNGFRTEKQNTVYQLGDMEKTSQTRVYLLTGGRRHLTIDIIAKMTGEQIVGFIQVNDSSLELLRVQADEYLQNINEEHLNILFRKMLMPKLEELILTK